MMATAAAIEPTLISVLKDVYRSLRTMGKPIDFYCKIKDRRCHDLSNNCPDCPLKQFQHEGKRTFQ